VLIDKRYNCKVNYVKLLGSKFIINEIDKKYVDELIDRKPWHFQKLTIDNNESTNNDYDHYYFECDDSFSMNPYHNNNYEDSIYIDFNEPYLKEYSIPIVIAETKNLIYYRSGMAGLPLSK
jgi:hypothetical protein